MATVNMHEAKTQLSKLVKRAAAGERIVLANAGRPVAMIVPYDGPSRPREPGAMEGQIVIARDFDELPPGFAEAFGA